MGGAGVCLHPSPDGLLTPLCRLAFLVRSTHGCRIIVYHGFLRAFFVSSFVKPNNFLLRQIIMFSDLECDYINPIDLCNKLNQVRVSPSVFSRPSDVDGVRWRVSAQVCHP